MNMRHGLIVLVAKATSAEAAILETTLAYRAKRYGTEDGEMTRFAVSESELEEMYPYFEKSIAERMESLDLIRAGRSADQTVYEIDKEEVGGETIYLVSVKTKWLEAREML